VNGLQSNVPVIVVGIAFFMVHLVESMVLRVFCSFAAISEAEAAVPIQLVSSDLTA
jgi:hypothetical protein